MWDKAVGNLPKWGSAVRNGLDAGGYPYSLRGVLERDDAGWRFCPTKVPGGKPGNMLSANVRLHPAASHRLEHVC